jgi:hypothetical protein
MFKNIDKIQVDVSKFIMPSGFLSVGLNHHTMNTHHDLEYTLLACAYMTSSLAPLFLSKGNVQCFQFGDLYLVVYCFISCVPCINELSSMPNKIKK